MPVSPLRTVMHHLRGVARAVKSAAYPALLMPPETDYEEYRRTQAKACADKIKWTFARVNNIAHVAHYARLRLGDNLSILCHGSRNGSELKWFAEQFPAARVLGTDIGPAAAKFPNTIEWDFHDLKDEWRGAWDIVYSNSWDHALDPARAFKNWGLSLAPNGLLFLEHSRQHTPAVPRTDIDVFGASRKGLVDFVNRVLAPDFAVRDVIRDLPNRDMEQSVLVVGRP